MQHLLVLSSSAEAAGEGGASPQMVDIVDDRLAIRIPNAAGEAENFVLGAL